MKRKFALCAAALCLTMALSPAALAAEAAQVCYPTSVTRSEDGAEIRKYYDLGPEEDPAGIPRSDFEQDGFRYTLTDLLKQELPEHESRQHTETVSLESKSKDMESVLALLPQEKEFITEDGLSGILTLRLDTVQVEVSGYGSSTREVSATRSYPNLANQDTANIPKTIEDGGRTLTLQNITWQTDNTATTDGYALGTLRIPAIGLSVKVYQGTDSATLAKGAGHFEDTSIWDGNVAFAAHNRGVNNHFGKIHTLALEDEITLTTKLGTRTYEVVSVSKVGETDRSGLAATTENRITLYTCVRDQRDYRWCVQAVEVG